MTLYAIGEKGANHIKLSSLKTYSTKDLFMDAVLRETRSFIENQVVGHYKLHLGSVSTREVVEKNWSVVYYSFEPDSRIGFKKLPMSVLRSIVEEHASDYPGAWTSLALDHVSKLSSK